LTALAALLGVASGSHAADTAEPTPAKAAAADPLAPARKAIQAQRWSAALEELRRVNASGSADWNNLMGYALRKQSPPDLDGAQRHYDAALRIDPRHRGTLEYSGELALMKGDLAGAEQRLAALGRVCGGPCEEQDDLKKAVDKYKANGNRYQP
jgi:Flp pilus assembly protein TadD